MSSSKMVKRGEWLVPFDKLEKVTRHIFQEQAAQQLTFGLVENWLQQRWQKGGDELDLEVYNYDFPPVVWEDKDRLEFLKDCGVEAPDPDEYWFGNSYREALRDAAEEAWNDYVTVFEWWRVTEQAAKVFMEMGKPVVYAFNEWYWGRATTGQSIYDDWAVQQVAATWYGCYTDEFPFLKRVEE